MNKDKFVKLIKENKDKLLKLIKNNKETILIILISIIALIIGTLALGFIKALIIVGIIDILLFLPKILKLFNIKINFSKKNNNKKSINEGENMNQNKTISNDKTKKIKQKKEKKKTSKSKKKLIFKIILITGFTMLIAVILAVFAFFYMIIKDAPKFDVDKLDKQEASIIYSDDGTIYAKLGVEKRTKVNYKQLPEVLVDAIIATEDSRFFQHNGFDLARFLKASLGQAVGNDAGGASTLTMQVVKNNFTSRNASGFAGIKRKFTDIYMSMFNVEKNFTKEQIMEFYVNDNFLGGASVIESGIFGVEEAAQLYFGKSVSDINLSEAALIAGLFQAPGAYDPFKYPEACEERRKQVLYLMERHGYITEEERRIANLMTTDKIIVKEVNDSNNEYLSFIDTVVREARDITGQNPYTTPMIIYTTMNIQNQNHINSIINGEIFAWPNEQAKTGIAVLNTSDGAIKAIGSSKQSDAITKNGFNYATGLDNQIGSTAKPIYDYAPSIEYNNASTGTIITDEPYSYTTGQNINNWDGQYFGLLTMREALKLSRNVPALKTFKSVDNTLISNFVQSLNLSPEIEGGKVHEAHAIGSYNGESPLSLAAAYASFGNKGYYNKPYSITKLVIRDTNETYEHKNSATKVMGEDTAYMVTSMLIDTAQYALGAYSSIPGITYGAKTGTTNFDDQTFIDKGLPDGAIKDLWVAGYDTEYAIAVWYGYDRIDPNYVSIWSTSYHSQLFQLAAKGIFKSPNKFEKPANVVEVQIEKETYPAMLPSEFTPEDMIITELFKEGTEPTEVSQRYAKLANPTNLNAKSDTNKKLTISWDPVTLPDAIDEQKLSAFSKSVFITTDFQNAYTNARMDYNKNNIGEIGYNVYTKNEDGTLKFIKFTKENKIVVDANYDVSSTTYVVKTTYSIFKNNMSDGAEIKVKLDQLQAIITSELNGEKSVNINQGSTYVDKGVIVLSNLTDITNKAEITKKIIKKSTNKVVDKIDTTKADYYTITYTVKYKDYTNTLTRTVNVIPKPTTTTTTTTTTTKPITTTTKPITTTTKPITTTTKQNS